MTGFPRRPLALLICSLLAGLAPAFAQSEALTPAAPAVEPGEATPPLKLRVERRFKVQSRRKQAPFAVGLPTQPELDKGESYPVFLVADEIVGRTDEVTDAKGQVELRRADALLFADALTYRPLLDDIDARGEVRLLQPGAEIATPHLYLKLAEQVGFAESADYRMVRQVPNRLYEQQQIAVANAAVNASTTSVNGSATSGAPMMMNVATNYGLPTTAPLTRTSEANGHAERIDFEGENQYRLRNATFSTCRPGQSDWYLKSADTLLDYDEELATARDASVWFKDVPIFYAPKATFSLNQRRTSGFLHPTYAFSSRNGLDVTAPFYWNIAPNYDVTLHPRYMAKRGVQLGADFRYLDYNYFGNTKVEYLPNDEVQNRQRYAVQWQHNQNLGRGVFAAVNYNRVSDDTYWQDMTSRLLNTSQVQLPQQVVLGYAPAPWLQTNMQVLRYQTLQPDPTTTITRPYFLEPQLNVVGYKANVFKTDLSLLGQYSRFTHPTQDQADRLVFYPQVSLPFVHPAFQLTTKLGMHMTQYAMDRRTTTGDNRLQRSLPTFSMDGTVVFERDTELFGRGMIQTLEPRLYYVHIPYRDQSRLPVFDTGLTDFNVAQIFAENRYSGFDRINDANQLTAALTTRLLDAETGSERFRALIGQRYYFSPQRVALPGETLRNNDFSNLIAGVSGVVLPKTYMESTWEYDHRANQSVRFSVGARYQPDYGKVLSASYRYTRDPLTNQAAVDQIDVAGQWPITPQWFAVGRYNYSLKDNRPLEAIAGVEYNAGCWAVRTVVQRLEAIAGTPNTTLFLQLELNDFASIGANPLQLLRRTIPGYGKMNELPTAGMPLTTP